MPDFRRPRQDKGVGRVEAITPDNPMGKLILDALVKRGKPLKGNIPARLDILPCMNSLCNNHTPPGETHCTPECFKDHKSRGFTGSRAREERVIPAGEE